MSHLHTHIHDHKHDVSKNIGIAFFLNFTFTIISLVGGILTNSIAIISDAIHDFGDTISLGMAWYFVRISKKGRTEKYTYGYKRFALLGAIITSVVLILGSVFILSEAIPRLFEPQVTNAKGMFFLAILGVVVNGVAVLRTRGGNSISQQVVSLHMLEDVLGWLAVLIGSVVMYFTGLSIIDPILSIGIALFVLFNVQKNIRATLPIFLQGTPSEIEQDKIIQSIKKLDGIADIHDLHIWSLDEEYKILTVHVVLDELITITQQLSLKRKIRDVLSCLKIQHATIEFEIRDEACDFESGI